VHDIERNTNFILLEKLLGTVYKDYVPADAAAPAGGKKGDAKKKKETKEEEAPKFKIVGSFQGKDMVGWRYVPMFDYFTEQVRTPPCYPTCLADFLV
jgi:isoleucyl-tRNA synthetase